MAFTKYFDSPTSRYGWYLRLWYDVAEQSAADNTSTVFLSLQLYVATAPAANVDAVDSNQGYYSVIGDAAATHYTYNYRATGFQTLETKQITVQHNDDGTGSVSISAIWNRGNILATYIPQELSVSGLVDLPQIPRSPVLGGVSVSRLQDIELDAWIQHRSKARVTFQVPELPSGVTVAAYKVRYNGTEKSSATNVVDTDELTETSVTLSCSFVDSRGLESNVVTQQISLLPYFAPFPTDIRVFRGNTPNAENEDGTNLYLYFDAEYAALEEMNSIVMCMARIREEGGTYPIMPVVPTLGETTLIKTGIDSETVYFVELTVIDSVNGAGGATVRVPAKAVTFSLREGGRGAAFGKPAGADNLLDVAWNFRTEGNAQIDGNAQINGNFTAQGSIFSSFGVCPSYRTDDGALVLRYAADKILGATDSAGILLIVDKQAQSKFFLGYYALTVGTAENIVSIAAADVSITASNNQGTIVASGGSGTYNFAVIPMIKI